MSNLPHPAAELAPSAGGLLRLPALDPALAGQAFAIPGVEAIEIPRPALSEVAYAGLVQRLLAAPPFMSDFSHTLSRTAFRHLCRRVLGHDANDAADGDQSADLLLAELAEIEHFAQRLCGPRMLVSMRNWFAPGDLVWHVDRSARAAAYRILWPLGRAAGMRVTPRENLAPSIYACWRRPNFDHPRRLNFDQGREAVAGTAACG